MTEQVYSCPIDGCDYTAGAKGSVKGHISRKTTAGHGGKSGPDYGDEISMVDVGSGGSEQSEQTGDEQATGNSAGVVPSEYQQSSGDTTESSECCSNPSLTGEAGDVFELDSGEHVRLEQGDEICVNCDTIHE